MYLGLDLGTTSVKAVVLDDRGRLMAEGSAGVDTYHLGDGGVEQDIEQIARAALAAMAEAAGRCDAAAIRAVGVSSQGGAMQLLDEAGQPAGRVISWLDGRGRDYNRKLTDELGKAWFAKHIGHNSSALTLGQLCRLRALGALPRQYSVGFVGDQVVKRLCGRAAHDATSLSLAMLCNPSLGRTDAETLKRMDLRESQLPEVLPARQSAGPLSAEAAGSARLLACLPVSPAVHDQYAAALGCGAIEAGEVTLGTGTAWVLLAISETLPPSPVNDAFVCPHVVPGRYGQLLSLHNGGSAIEWAMGILGLNDRSSKQIDELLSQSPPGCEGVRFRPFLAAGGNGLPPETSGRFSGLRLAHGAPHLLRAVVEGLVFELARHVRLLERSGAPVRRVILSGGAAGSAVTPQIMADALGVEVQCVTEPATSAIGAAMIARAVVEPRTSWENIVQAMRPPVRSVTPGAAASVYARLAQEYLDSLPSKEGR